VSESLPAIARSITQDKMTAFSEDSANAARGSRYTCTGGREEGGIPGDGGQA